MSGSETSEDYIMQTFTPPYLVGNPNRCAHALLKPITKQALDSAGSDDASGRSSSVQPCTHS